MENITIEKAIEAVQTSGKKAAEHEHKTTLIEAVCTPGSYVRQGDILLTFMESFDGTEDFGSRQLAPGNTQGSRHIVEGDARVLKRGGSALQGPVIVAGPGGCTITHPEHRHYEIPAGTICGVTYERDLSSEEIARVQD